MQKIQGSSVHTQAKRFERISVLWHAHQPPRAAHRRGIDELSWRIGVGLGHKVGEESQVVPETISDDSINAILESNLPVAPNDDERPLGNRGKYSSKGTLEAITNNKSTRVDDNDVVIRACVRFTRASSIAEFNAAMEDAHEDFLRDVGTSGRHTRYRLLTSDWLVPGSKTLKLVEKKKASMMANVGNAGARNHRNEEIEENSESIAPLYKLRIGARFWLLDEKQSFPSVMPATIASSNPKHNGASYPVYRMKCNMVRSRVPRDYDKDPVYARQTPANRPPYGWDIEIVGKHLKTLSRKKANGSTFVLVASKLREKK